MRVADEGLPCPIPELSAASSFILPGRQATKEEGKREEWEMGMVKEREEDRR
jgi:hypothetical protein